MLEMAQLWVNLPARAKMTPPRYQDITGKSIPTVSLPGDAGTVRVVAGEFRGTTGAATTVTPVILWDVALTRQNNGVEFPIPKGQTSGVFVRRGSINVGGKSLAEGDIAIFETEGDAILIENTSPSSNLLILGGEPINEPVVAYGPFVMNTEEEIQAAITDLRAGRFGQL